MIKIFDRKGDFAGLTHFENFAYILWKDFCTNWVTPPPLPILGEEVILRWLATLFEILSNHLDVRVATRGLLMEVAKQLCSEWESIRTGTYPTFKNISQAIAEKKYPLMSHQSRHRETALNRLDGLIDTLGVNICSPKQFLFEKYMRADCAICLSGIPTDYQSLIIAVEIGKIMTYRILNNMRSNRLECLIVIDEASTVFKRAYEQRGSTYLLLDYLAQAREFGVGFIIATQSLSNLAQSVMANTGTKALVGGAGAGQDYDLFASAVGLDANQKAHLTTLNLPGRACIRDPRYPHPFLLEVPRVSE